MNPYPLTRESLDEQADRIESVLTHHKIDAVVSGGTISPRWIRFTIEVGYATKVGKVKSLAEELALALDVLQVRISRSNGILAVEVPLEEPHPIYLLNLLKSTSHLPPVTAVLGMSVEGEPFTLELTAPEVTHVLVSGATGSGKTVLLRSLLLSLALYNRQANVQMVLVDPKKRGFAPLEELPHLLHPVAYEAVAAEASLGQVVAEMERRDREGAPPTPRIIVAVDEVADLLMTGSKNIKRYLIRIAQRGREAGVHLVLSTQKPSADAIPSALKSNFPARLVGKVASGQDALVAAGVPGTNAELLMGVGDFLAVVGGQVVRLQAAYADPADIPDMQQQFQSMGTFTADDAGQTTQPSNPSFA